MSRSNWSARLTLVLAATSAFIFMAAVVFAIVSEQYAKIHQVNARYQQTAEQDRENTAREIQEACTIIQPPAFAKCLAKEMKAYDSKQASNKDLQAQQDMALWAFWAAFFGGAGVLVTGTGIFFVWQTLEANRDAVRAAEKSVEIARLAHVVEQRPWIAVRAIKGDNGVLSNDVISAFLWIRYTNIGKTPATVVITHSRSYFRGTNPPDIVSHFVPELEKHGKHMFGKTLVPGDWFEIGHNALIAQKNILVQEAAVYKTFLSLRIAIGATYKSTLSDDSYHSVRSFMVNIKQVTEGSFSADKVEVDELDGGSDFI